MLVSLLKSLGRGTPPAQPAAAASVDDAAPRLRYARGGRIVAFCGPSEGDALREHTLEMVEPLRARCAGVYVLDVSDPHWARSFAEAASEPLWFAMASFGVGELTELGGGRFANRWAEARIPFVRLFGDVPAYFPVKHEQRFATSINGYGHAEHHDFFLRWFEPRSPSVWLPLYPFDAVARDAVDVERKTASALVLFPKNGNSPQQLVDYWRSALPPAVSAALQAVGETLFARIDEPADIAASVQAHFAALDVDLSGNRELVFFLVAQLDDYLRRVKSTMIVESLLDLPVTIRGNRWEHVDFNGRRAVRDHASDYASTRALLDSATAVIDMSPNTHRGPHDRVLRAAGRYTAFLTNRTQFFTNSFRNAAAFTFRFEPDSIRARVEAALERPRETVEMGIEQAVRLRELLTRERYVEQLVAAVDACALACSGPPPGTQPYIDYRPLR